MSAAANQPAAGGTSPVEWLIGGTLQLRWKYEEREWFVFLDPSRHPSQQLIGARAARLSDALVLLAAKIGRLEDA